MPQIIFHHHIHCQDQLEPFLDYLLNLSDFAETAHHDYSTFLYLEYRGILPQNLRHGLHNVGNLVQIHENGSVGGRGDFISNAFLKPKDSLVILADLEQYCIEDAYGPIHELATKTQRDGSLFGIGSRNIPVRLAYHQDNTDLLIIQSLFYSLLIGPDKLRVASAGGNVTPAYATLGETSSGMYVLNRDHHNCIQFYQKFNRGVISGNLQNSAADFFLVQQATSWGTIATRYVLAVKNVFPNSPKAKEREETEELIASTASRLQKTSMRLKLLSILESKRRIAEFYPVAQVELVADLMRACFEIKA